jgi:hypothetical protein
MLDDSNTCQRAADAESIQFFGFHSAPWPTALLHTRKRARVGDALARCTASVSKMIRTADPLPARQKGSISAGHF